MAKKPEGEPFNAIVSNRLRKVSKIRQKYVIKRKEAFETRNDLIARIEETSAESAKDKLKAQCWDVEQEIKRTAANIKSCDNDIHKTIEAADDPKLFQDLDPNPTERDLFTAQEEAEEKDAEEKPENEMAGAK